MSIKKSKGKSRAAAKKSSKESANKLAKESAEKSEGGSTSEPEKPGDLVQVRQKIDDLVRGSAEDIAAEVIRVAKKGQLAPAKYLFEMAGVYPLTEETGPKAHEDSLAQILLKRLGLPLEPVVVEEDSPVCDTSVAEAQGAEVVGSEKDTVK